MMANGTIDEKIARADRIREQSQKSARAADLNRRATANAIAALRGRELPPYREEMDSGEVTMNTGPFQGAVKGVPRWALGFAIVALSVAGAIVAVLRFWPR